MHATTTGFFWQQNQRERPIMPSLKFCLAAETKENAATAAPELVRDSQ
jgi:hypothetical protein